MAALVSYQASVTSSAASSSYSLSYSAATAAGQERLLGIICVSNGASSTLAYSNVAIDGQTASAVGSYVRGNDGTANGPVLAFYRAAGTSSTTFNVTFDCDDVPFDARTFLWTLTRADTLLDTGSATQNNAVLGTALSLDLDTAANGCVAAIALFQVDPISGTSAWSGLTERFDGGGLYGVDWHTASDLNVGSSGSTPLAVTVTPSVSHIGGAVAAGLAVSFNQVAGFLDGAAGSYALTGVAAPFGYLLIAEPG